MSPLLLDHLVNPFLTSLWRNNFRLLSFFFLTSGASSGASTGSSSGGSSCDSSAGSGTSSSSSSSSVQEDMEASLQFSMSRDPTSQDWLWRWREGITPRFLMMIYQNPLKTKNTNI